MLAFSGCDFGGGEKERNELGAVRKRWKTLHVSLLCFTNVFKLCHLIAILYYIYNFCLCYNEILLGGISCRQATLTRYEDMVDAL